MGLTRSVPYRVFLVAHCNMRKYKKARYNVREGMLSVIADLWCHISYRRRAYEPYSGCDVMSTSGRDSAKLSFTITSLVLTAASTETTRLSCLEVTTDAKEAYKIRRLVCLFQKKMAEAIVQTDEWYHLMTKIDKYKEACLDPRYNVWQMNSFILLNRFKKWSIVHGVSKKEAQLQSNSVELMLNSTLPQRRHIFWTECSDLIMCPKLQTANISKRSSTTPMFVRK